MSETTQGKRVKYDRIDFLKPGEYGKHPDLTFYAMTPDGRLAWLKNHQVTEHEDGTITVSPSILVRGFRPGEWHGYLERGVWRSV